MKAIVTVMTFGVMLLVTCAWADAADAPRLLVPAPQKVQWSSEPLLTLAGKTVAIVVGDKATEPEKYAAQRLAEQVEKRFALKWPIVPENQMPAANVVILVGQRSTHQRLDALCKEKNIELSEASPGFDGYVIETLKDDGRDVVLVGGSNPRGAIYGQDTLFQLIDGPKDQPTLARASIRDWPTVPWRGRPQTAVSHYLQPGEMDLLAASRINFIDLRNGTYAYSGGDELEKDIITRAIAEAHRRGMIVFGTVNCGIPKTEQDAVMDTFREMITLGADGLWISFDDKGPGEDPVGMTSRALALGRQHDMTGPLIAITPPKGSYQDVFTDFNRKIMAVPGMEQALWFWTALPNKTNTKLARSIGLKCRPSWWHNWPRIWITPIYQPVPPMALGWHGPDDEILATLTSTCEAVMPWGGNQLPQWYVAPICAWWGWNPAAHRFVDVRARIYNSVFGPALVEKMQAFDDKVTKLQAMLRYPMDGSEWCPFYPPRLRNPADRDAAMKILAELEPLLADIEINTAGQSLIDAQKVAGEYLKRMREEIDYDKALVQLPFPEYWWIDYQRKVLEAVHAGDMAKADKLMAAVRDRLLDETNQIAERLKGRHHVKEYTEFWTRMAQLDGRGWQQLLVKRQEEFKASVAEYALQNAKLDEMVKPLKNPPLDWGTAHWDRTNRLRATVLPTSNEQYWGCWIGGQVESYGEKAVVFAAKRRASRSDGEFCELKADVPVSGRRDRLALLLYFADINKDAIGGQSLPYRWGNHTFLQVLWGDKVIWEGDVGPARQTGQWLVAKLPTIPDNVAALPLRVRVEDRIWIVKNYTFVLVGPIRLIELAEP